MTTCLKLLCLCCLLILTQATDIADALAKTEDIQAWIVLVNDLMDQCTGSGACVSFSFLNSVGWQVTERYPHDLNVFHQCCISAVWTEFLQKSPLCHRELVQSMKVMMSQNRQLSIGLERSVWNTFYAKHYSTPCQKYYNLLVPLMYMMTEAGSYIIPTSETVEIIMSGVRKAAISEPQRQRILDEVVLFACNFMNVSKKTGTIHGECIYQSQFRSFVKRKQFSKVTALFLAHPDVVFVHMDILFVFNNCLAELTNANILKIMIQQILPKYPLIRLNLDSYQILRRFCGTNSHVGDLGEIHAHPEHASISMIISKIHSLYALKDHLGCTDCLNRDTFAQWIEITNSDFTMMEVK